MNTSRLPRRSRGGFTLIEVLIALTLFGLVIANLYMVFGSSTKALDQRSVQFDTDVEARRVLDRIAMAVIGAQLDSVHVPQTMPNSSESIDFAVNLGFEDGSARWSTDRRIAHDGEKQITWTENPGEPDERHAIWTSYAAPFLEGEVLNGLDDNDNGLIDERGLSIHVDGRMLVIELTISKPGSDGKLVAKTVETRVTCRN